MIHKLKIELKHRLKPYLKPLLNKFGQQNTSTLEAAVKMETIYHDEVDKRKLKQLQPYETKASSLSLSDVFYSVNYNFYSAYGPDFKHKDCMSLSIDGPAEYRRFLKKMLQISNLKVETFDHYHPDRPLQNNEIACVIRHDLDGDLVAALQQAKIEQELNIKTTYYILHTAPYYGQFEEDGVFARNSESIESYKLLQEHGHEVALHTDGMLAYQEFNRDGGQTIRDEIEWLRSNGLMITGTTAHNSWPIYGVENFSIFKGKDRGKWQGKKAVTHNGKWAPIGALSEKELGLKYEANELLWQNKVPVFYAALRSQNLWRVDFLNFSKDLLDEHHKFGRLKDFKNKFVSGDDVLDLIACVNAPAYVYLVVHPMHYGLRSDHNEGPWLPDQPVNTESGGQSKWAGYETDNNTLNTAICFKNELDTYDRGLDCYKSATQKIFCLGNHNLASNQVSVDSKYSQVAAQNIGRQSKITRTAATSFASENSSLELFKEAYQQVIKIANPDYIIIALSYKNPDLWEIIAWSNEIRSTSKQLITIMDDASEKKFETMCSQNKLAVPKINLYAPDVFDTYLGSGALYRDKAATTWAPQAHFLLGTAISDEVIKNIVN